MISKNGSEIPLGLGMALIQNTEAFFRFFVERYPGRVYKGDWNRSVWYNHETVAYWYDLAGQRYRRS